MRFSGLFFCQNGYICRLLVFNVSRRRRIFIDVGIASMLTCDTTVIKFLKENIYIYEYLHACLDVIQLVGVKRLQKSSRQGRGRDVSAHINITTVNKYISLFCRCLDLAAVRPKRREAALLGFPHPYLLSVDSTGVNQVGLDLEGSVYLFLHMYILFNTARSGV
jgi:hypothetical protein